MSTEYLTQMFQQRSQTRIVRFDEQVVAKAALDDFAPEHWKHFKTERTEDDQDGLPLTICAAGGEHGSGTDAKP